VRKLREYLNKLTKTNYSKIKQSILTKFSFNAQLLKQLSKIIFIKSTTEQNYIELYVDLCEELFKKFNDKDQPEMNFKKLLL
jgi:MIF4G domain